MQYWKPIIVASFVFSLATPVFAATSTNKISLTPTPTPMIKKVDYPMPYPGILPDHPLYSLKGIRDRMLDWLIVDPVRKTEFYVLQGDKRLVMGLALFDKGKDALAETTLTKGTNYMDHAISTLVNFRASGKEIPGYLVDRLERSVAKQKELLEEARTKVSDTQEKVVAAVLETLVKLEQELPKLK